MHGERNRQLQVFFGSKRAEHAVSASLSLEPVQSNNLCHGQRKCFIIIEVGLPLIHVRLFRSKKNIVVPRTAGVFLCTFRILLMCVWDSLTSHLVLVVRT